MATFRLLVTLTCLVCLTLAAAHAGPMERVSVDSWGLQGNGDSFSPAISADGRFVAFDSAATDLVDEDTNSATDVLVFDRQTGEIARVSVATGGTQADAGSFLPSLSASGRYVAFESDAPNLVDGDTNVAADIFVHDLQTGDTVRVSVATGDFQGNDGSYLASISADGRYVSFDSDATDLVSDDTNAAADVFVHDLQTGETVRVSVSSDETESDGSSYAARISEDGRYVTFVSDATNLVAGDTNGVPDVFVRDQASGETVRASLANGGGEGNDGSYSPAISGDGRYVVFDSDATNLVADDTNGAADVFMHDLVTGVTTRVSVSNSGDQGNGHSFMPTISAEGRHVAFWSEAANLAAGDSNLVPDIFVHDLLTGMTTRDSVSDEGSEGNYGSYSPAISGDGRYVAFDSDATNLVADDTNGVADVFVRDDLMYTLTVGGTTGQVLVDGTPHLLPWVGTFIPMAIVTLEAVPDGCSVFDSWSGDITGSANPVPVVMAGDRSITANFVAQGDFMLTVEGVGNGSVKVNGVLRSLPWTEQFPCGTDVVVEGVPDVDWVLFEWTGALTGNANPDVVTMNSAMTVTAHFSPDFPVLSLTRNGNGTVIVNGTERSLPWTEEFASGTEVTLEAIPDACWVFDSWSGDFSSDLNPDVLLMNGDKEILANFLSLSIFADVPCDHWATQYIGAVFVAGIVEGFPDGSYQPTLPVTRDQMSTSPVGWGSTTRGCPTVLLNRHSPMCRPTTGLIGTSSTSSPREWCRDSLKATTSPVWW